MNMDWLLRPHLHLQVQRPSWSSRTQVSVDLASDWKKSWIVLFSLVLAKLCENSKKARSCAMFFSRCTFDPSFLGKNYAKGSFNRLSLPVDMDGGELRGIVTTKLWQMYDIIIVYIIWLFYPILYIFKEFFLESSVYPPHESERHPRARGPTNKTDQVMTSQLMLCHP